jgi:hypothetical protein
VRKLHGPILHFLGGEYLDIESLFDHYQLDYYQNIQQPCDRVKGRCRNDAIVIAHLRVLMLERQGLPVRMQAHIDEEVGKILRSCDELI